MRLAIAATLIALAGTAGAAESREDATDRKVARLLAPTVEHVDRLEGRIDADTRERRDRLAGLDRSLRLIGLAASAVDRDVLPTARRAIAEVESILAGVRPDRSRFAGELLATEAARAREALAIAARAIEEGKTDRGIAALRVAALYAGRARDVAAISVLPLFEE